MFKNVVIATDAWDPQVNGVVRTLKTTAKHLMELGCYVYFITPNNGKSYHSSLYPEIPLVYQMDQSYIDKMLSKENLYVHIATEGGVGKAVRQHCLKNNLNFTTSYHSKFPDMLWDYAMIPRFLSYPYFRRFHAPSARVMVPTLSVKYELEKRKFKNVVVWSRGVDTDQFKPAEPRSYFREKPVALCVSRVSKEKNIEAFLSLKGDYIFRVVGDGPIRAKLQKKYPHVEFVGIKRGSLLVAEYQNADVFVFPSKKDTFGLVTLEALACGLPVATYPVTGPKDVCELYGKEGGIFMDECLQKAFDSAFQNKNSLKSREMAETFKWKSCSNVFLNQLVPANA